MIRVLFTLCLALGATLTLAQSQGKGHDYRRSGDRDYNQKKYEEAEEAYRRSILVDPEAKGHHNLGNAIYKQSRYDDAAQEFERAM